MGRLYDWDDDEPPAAVSPSRRGRLFDQDESSAPPVRPRPAAGEVRRPVVQISSRAVSLPGAPQDIGGVPSVSPRQAPGQARKGEQGTRRATVVMAAGTFASRATGFLRVLAIGYVLGVGSLSDAFNYANGAPNVVYDLLLGGILSATLVPVFVEQLGGDDERARSRSVSAVVTSIGVALLVMSALLWLAAPLVIRFYLILDSASTGPAERELATRLLRWFSPQVFFLGAIVTSTALLNARRRFTAAAVSPVVNNIIAIAALLATKAVANTLLTSRSGQAGVLSAFSKDERAVVILGAGTTAGYAVQLLVQLPSMRHLGFRLRPVWEPRHPAVRRVAVLSTWLIGVVVANQIALALVMVLAGRTNGGVTAYQFSYQFFQLPYALIAVSVASAIMPNLSEYWSGDRRVAFERQLVRGLRITLAMVLPVAGVYVAVAQPFISLAIHHGRVTGSGAHMVGASLALFAVGLPGFCAFFILMRAFQAMQDARTMLVVYVLENGMTVVAALVLDRVLGVPGLALAWVGPYTLAALYAARRLRPTAGSLGGWLTVRALMRITVASAFAVAAAVALGFPFRHASSDPLLVARLVIQVGGAAVVYAGVGRLVGIRELRPIMAMAGRLTGRDG